ncbi:hypothetical protein L618_001700000230 [Rhodococcus rhodochrous J45]|uniref:Uncharacterized protein n=1 Tax=Rhodococcus rhodochrous J45 TaxID=935266 RepID=A0A562E7V3_RHORH|nr:hypothetical protein L618_001700000230 [Rhodococcus rhodochrous J45]
MRGGVESTRLEQSPTRLVPPVTGRLGGTQDRVPDLVDVPGVEGDRRDDRPHHLLGGVVDAGAHGFEHRGWTVDGEVQRGRHGVVRKTHRQQGATCRHEPSRGMRDRTGQVVEEAGRVVGVAPFLEAAASGGGGRVPGGEPERIDGELALGEIVRGPEHLVGLESAYRAVEFGNLVAALVQAGVRRGGLRVEVGRLGFRGGECPSCLDDPLREVAGGLGVGAQ